MTRTLALIALVGALSVIGCSSSDGSEPSRAYSANIVRTTYGVPHITADTYGDMGFGVAYAYAQDNVCLFMREVVRANGQTTRYWGEEDGDFANDYVYTYFNRDEVIENELLADQSDQILEALEGYAVGFNQYLTDTGIENLAEDCRGQEWVRPITILDVGKVIRKLILFASTDQLKQGIYDAEPPSQSLAQTIPGMSAPLDLSGIVPEPSTFGSNAYGIGSESSQTDYGLLLGNPHFPWQGNRRFYMLHITIPGEIDAMGATITGLPLVLIGFNENVAWSHTVSTARRFTLYDLELVEGEPLQYLYDDEIREIEAIPVTIEVMTADGTVEEQTDNLYFSHFGPIVDAGFLQELLGGWPTISGTLLTYRDANMDNTRALTYWEAMDKAESIGDIQDALRVIGNPWVNTIAADRNGEALYADVTVVPHVSGEKLEACNSTFLTQQINAFGVPALSGATSDCEWGNDDDSPQEGIFGYENLPQLRTREYVGNSNDSYWLSNPDDLITGFSPVIGREGVEQTLRTRQGFVQAEARMAATDGMSDVPGYNIELLQDMLYSNMDIAEQLTRSEVVTICRAVESWAAGDCSSDDGDQPYSENPAEAATSCDIIENWDGLYDEDSVGSSVWREFWDRVRGTENLWSVPFDATDPVNTPNDLNDGDPAVVEAVRCALGGAVDRLVRAEIPLDRPWGEAQFRWNGDRTQRIPIHGGRGRSTFSVISSGLVDGEGYSDITTGNSYIHTVTWDESECPDAYAVLTYSQSVDPASPHYSDMTEVYSAESWNDMPFCADDIEAETISEIDVGTP